jgi:hypothetical protein
MGCGSSSAVAPIKAEAIAIKLDYSKKVDSIPLSCRNGSDVKTAGLSEPICPALHSQSLSAMLIQGTHIELVDFKQSLPHETRPCIGDGAQSDCAAPDSEFSGRSTDNTYDPELDLDDLNEDTCILGESLRLSGEANIAESLGGQKLKRLVLENMNINLMPRLKAALKSMESVEEIELNACEVCK